MKINGQAIIPPEPVKIVIPREGSDPVILQAEPIMDWSEFDSLCPAPTPPIEINNKTKQRKKLYNHPRYLQQVEEHSTRRSEYQFIKSLLLGTEGLEFETVQLEDPTTWKNIEDEMRKVFTEYEYSFILNEVMMIGLPTKERQEEALRLFSERQKVRDQLLSDSLKEEQSIITSGEPANDSE